MDVLGVNGQRITKSDEDIKNQEAFLKAKIMESARKRGIMKAEFKGYIKGEPIFGDPLDGFTPEAVALFEQMGKSSLDPNKSNVINPMQKVVIQPVMEEVKPVITNKKDISKDIFGF